MQCQTYGYLSGCIALPLILDWYSFPNQIRVGGWVGLNVWSYTTTITTSQPFYSPFSGTTRVSRCQKRRELLDFMAQGKINRGRHTDDLAGPTPSGLISAHLHHPPIFFTGWMPFLPPNQQRQSTEGTVQQHTRLLHVRCTNHYDYSYLQSQTYLLRVAAHNSRTMHW